MNGLVCALCNREITSVETTYFSVEGWERDRPQGGTNHVKMRKRTGKAAHKVCLDREERGLTGQGSLL